MIGSAAALPLPARPAPFVAGDLTQLQSEREQLTHLLRGLAARLDGLDRDLADLDWRHRHPRHRASRGETPGNRATLQRERERLSARLTVLARQLNDLDRRLSDGTFASPRVGICPECGYPSLGSGLCAFCRPHLVR